MTVLDKLATALDRRDEVPNQLLAEEIVRGKDKKAVQELVKTAPRINFQCMQRCR
jgi:hypothetical protein